MGLYSTQPTQPTQNDQSGSNSVGSVGSVGKTSNSGDDNDDSLLKQIAEKAMKDNQGNSKGCFTKEDWLFACQMWPNLHWTEVEAEQTLYELLEEVKIREISGKPGMYEPNSLFYNTVMEV